MSSQQKKSSCTAPQDEFDQLKDKLLDEASVDQLKGMAEEMAKDAAEIVRKYPGRSLAGAFVAGVLLGAWLNRK